MDTSVIERNFKPPVSKKSTDRSRWMTSNISNRIKEAIKKLQNFEKIEFPIIINALKVPPIFIVQTSSRHKFRVPTWDSLQHLKNQLF